MTMFLHSNDSAASEQQLNWSLRSKYEHNNNIRLSSNNKESVSGAILQPKVRYQFSNNIDTLSSDILVSLERFNRPQYDFNHYTAAVDYKRVLNTQRFSIGVDSNRRATRSTEIDDTGNVGNVASFKIDTIGDAGWQYFLNRTNSLSLAVALQSTHYETEALADFQFANAGLGWQNTLSTTMAVTTQLYYTEFKSEFSQDFLLSPRIIGNRLVIPPIPSSPGDVTTRSETTGIQTGLNWQLSQQLTLNTVIGVGQTQSDQTVAIESVITFVPPATFIDFGGNNTNSSKTTTYTFESSIDYQFETSKLVFEISRDTRASGNGSLREFDNVEIDYNSKLSDISELTMRLRASRRSNIDDSTISLSNSNRRYHEAFVSYTRRLNASWSGVLTMRYRSQEFADERDNDTAESLSGTFEIRYQPQSRIW